MSRRLQHIKQHLTSASSLSPYDSLSEEEVARVNDRYAKERDVRVSNRPEGTAQYVRLLDLAKQDARFARMISDPWCHKPEGRQPKQDTVNVAIIGAGYGGLLAGCRLVQSGFSPSEIRLIDSASEVGGTWYWNRYPGASCDIESYTYMPMLEELGFVPSAKYATQPELQEHSRLMAEKFGLNEKALLSTACTGLTWNEDTRFWTVKTDKGDCFRARFVFMNFGTLTQPKLPGVKGIESFKGHMIHTSRWDYDYTGGNALGGLTGLRDKRVAIIGTGATAVQCIPHLGQHAKELYVFQRTPSSVDERNNAPTSKEFIRESLSKPGWQKERMENFLKATQGNDPFVEDIINDGWTKIFRNLQQEFLVKRRQLFKSGGAIEDKLKMITDMMMTADMKQMNAVRSRCEKEVNNPETAEALKPWYQQFCKRPCFHDDYLPTFNRHNVKLIHDPLGVERITETGVVSKGVEYEVDLIIFATGFEVAFEKLDCGYPIVGRGGLHLLEKWKDGPRTLYGLNTSQFPNLFLQNAPQGTISGNFVQNLDEGAQYAACLLKQMRLHGLEVFEVSKQAEDGYCEEVFRKSGRNSAFLAQCTPGYYNREGTTVVGQTLNSIHSAPVKFFGMLRGLRDDPDSILKSYHVQ